MLKWSSFKPASLLNNQLIGILSDRGVPTKVFADFLKADLDENYSPDFYVTSLDGQFVRAYPFSVWREIPASAVAGLAGGRGRFEGVP